MKYKVWSLMDAPQTPRGIDTSVTLFEHAINRAIQEGWKPIGGVAVSANPEGDSCELFQAMTHD